MYETATVIENKKTYALVKVKKDQSKKCKGCGLCYKVRGDKYLLKAKNEIGAETGEKVKIEISENVLLKISLFIYLFPLLGFLLGIFTAYVINNMLLKIISFLLIFVGAWYAGLSSADKLVSHYKPEIKEKL
jgi:positive regulator of sigma E activity